MAQALFDDHPLEQYLRQAGEAHELMPGGVAEFVVLNEEDLDTPDVSPEDAERNPLESLLPDFIIRALQLLHSIFTTIAPPSTSSSAFVERFKYDVISSSLLSSSLSTSHHPRRPISLSIPGKLNHSRDESIDLSDSPIDGRSRPPPSTEPSQSWTPTIACICVTVLFGSGHYMLSLISLGYTLYYIHTLKADGLNKPDTISSLETLHDLVAAGNVWDSVVQDALSNLENEERRSTYYGPSSPSSPSSSLRIALSSSLHTTQTQCDNIRQLFSALTSPTELSQLSEMYAPPSPMKQTFSLSPDRHSQFMTLDGNGNSIRPFSTPAVRSASAPSDYTTTTNKRSTWNGSYSSLARQGSPTMQVLKRRQKRRSDLSSLLQPALHSASAPVSPTGAPTLSGVREEDDNGDDSDHQTQTASYPEQDPDETSPFGMAALDLHRKRKSGGLETFGIPPPSYYSSIPPPMPRSPRPPPSPTPSVSSSSRFTTMQPMRHPLSISALHHALQSALASKRYACSHLLALRFGEEEDEGYWEDVRSVMGLLTSTFVDASSRLMEALEDGERQRLKDSSPTPEPRRDGSLSPMFGDLKTPPRARSSQLGKVSVSFAPMPSHVSRFAAHVDAISTALNDAREHLEQCVASLRDGITIPVSDTDTPEKQDGEGGALGTTQPTTPEPPALQAYERLRRELGLALRECERGRERLVEIVSPRDPFADEGDGDPDDLPALGQDLDSEDSDKPDSNTPLDEVGQEEAVRFIIPGVEGVDDATSHLLLTSTPDHLPPPGVEQVFEGDSGNGPMFTRERSRMTREERIQLVKARRESGISGGGLGFHRVQLSEDDSPPATMEKWGPGGEVVQELKDVIWKVGERRRKMMSDGRQHNVVPSDSTLVLDHIYSL